MVANADPRELVPVLMQAQASKVLSGDRNDDKYQKKLLEKAHIITESANRIWREFLSVLGGGLKATQTDWPIELEMQKDLEEE